MPHLLVHLLSTLLHHISHLLLFSLYLELKIISDNYFIFDRYWLIMQIV